MRDCDLADSPLASYTPDIPGEIESLRDVLISLFRELTEKLPLDDPQRRALAEASRSAIDRSGCNRRQISTFNI